MVRKENCDFGRRGVTWRWPRSKVLRKTEKGAKGKQKKTLTPVLRFLALIAFLFTAIDVRSQSLSDVQALLRQAREDALAIQPPQRRFSVLSKIAAAQSRAKDPSGALSTALQALSVKLAVSDDASSLDELETLITIQFQGKDRDGAARTLDRLLRAATNDKIESARITLAAAQARIGDTTNALKTAQRSPAALARIAEVQSQTGDRTAALATLKEASKAIAALPEHHRARELAYLGLVHFQAGDQRGAGSALAEAARLASGGDNKPASPMAFLTQLPDLQQIAAAQILAGDSRGASTTLESALRLARMHPDDASRTSHLNGIARAFAEAGNKAECMKVLREARAMANKATGDRVRQSALWLEIAEVEAEAGYGKEAAQTLDHLWNSLWKPASKQMIQEAEAAIAKIRDEKTRAEARADLGPLVNELNKSPHWTAGLRAAFALQSDWLVKLAAIQAKLGQQAEAATTFQQAAKAALLSPHAIFSGPPTASLASVAFAQALAGEFQAAAGWVGKLTESESRALSRLAIARGSLNRSGIKSCDFPRLMC